MAGRPIGRLYVHRRESEIGVVDIALLPAYRKQGIGGLLLREILAEAAAASKPVRIYVERFNPAQHLYERLGFRQIGDWAPTFTWNGRLPLVPIQYLPPREPDPCLTKSHSDSLSRF